jgi:micrococcal nuclease
MGLSASPCFFVALTAGWFGLTPSACATEAGLFPGPVQARVLEILDGDTFLAEALVWPGHSVRVNVRIRGIDAPEMRSRCEEEKAAANLAREALAGMIAAGGVSISNIGGAKYYGRVLADVSTAEGTEVAEALLRRELVRDYDGGKRTNWCG